MIYQKLINRAYRNDHDLLTLKNISKLASQICISSLLQLHQKIHQNDVNILSIEIRPKSTSKWHHFFRRCPKNYVETMLIFRPLKLRWIKYVERTTMFLLIKIMSMKVRQNNVDFLAIKITLKWRGNSSMFSIPCINNISTLMAYPLGFFYQFSLFVIFPRKRLQRHCRTAAQSKFLISVSYVFSQCDTDSYCEHTADGVYM